MSVAQSLEIICKMFMEVCAALPCWSLALTTLPFTASGVYNGVALGARIAFLDIGDSRNVLYGPSVNDEYPVLSYGDAHIFTNSWGAPFDGNGYYSGYSVDQYLYNNMVSPSF
jgi:hypothetical protein